MRKFSYAIGCWHSYLVAICQNHLFPYILADFKHEHCLKVTRIWYLQTQYIKNTRLTSNETNLLEQPCWMTDKQTGLQCLQAIQTVLYSCHKPKHNIISLMLCTQVHLVLTMQIEVQKCYFTFKRGNMPCTREVKITLLGHISSRCTRSPCGSFIYRARTMIYMSNIIMRSG